MCAGAHTGELVSPNLLTERHLISVTPVSLPSPTYAVSPPSERPASPGGSFAFRQGRPSGPPPTRGRTRRRRLPPSRRRQGKDRRGGPSGAPAGRAVHI